MVTQELLDYIKTLRARKIDEKTIRTTLKSSNWEDKDITYAFDLIKEKGRIRFIIVGTALGVIIAFLLTIAIFISTFTKTQGLKTGSYSITLSGPSTPNLMLVQSILKKSFPNANINLSWNKTSNQETGKMENILQVIIENNPQLTSAERKQVAENICGIYATGTEELDSLAIWSFLPKFLGIIPHISLNTKSVEVRTCTDWLTKPAII